MGKKGKRNNNSNNKSGGKKKNAKDCDDGNHASSTRASQENNNKKAGKKKERKGNTKQRTKDDCDDKFRASLQADGRYSIVEVDADGNCLFRSISDQLFHDHGKKHHTDVRSAVCDYIEQHEDDFSVFLVLDENEEDDDAADFESYVKTMREDGEWGGNLELVAAAKLYCRNITVFSANANMSAMSISHGEESSSGPDLLVSYHDNDHYSSVRDIKADVPFQPFEMDATTSKGSNSSSDSNNARGKNKSKSKKPSCRSVEGSKEDAVENSNDNSVAATKDATPPSAPLENGKENNVDESQSEQAPEQETGKKVRGPRKNSLCPCDSGKKYKKCCWAQERHQARLKTMKDASGDMTEEAPKDESFEMNGNFRVLQI